jgi:G3E family GTPase
LDWKVRVVDCLNFFEDFSSKKTNLDRNLAYKNDEDRRQIVNLLTDQIEFANVIVLYKTDLISANELGTVRSMITKLNPKAKILIPLNPTLTRH